MGPVEQQATSDPKPLRAGWGENGLPLPDPFPEYVACPHCGEPEVEVWCYQVRARCHACGAWIDHATAPCVGCEETCSALSRQAGEQRPGAEHQP